MIYTVYDMEHRFVLNEKEEFALELIMLNPRIRTAAFQERLKAAGHAWNTTDRDVYNPSRGAPHKELQKLGLITYETAGRAKEWMTTQIGARLWQANGVRVSEGGSLPAEKQVNMDEVTGVDVLFDLISRKVSDNQRNALLRNLPESVKERLLSRTMIKREVPQ